MTQTAKVYLIGAGPGDPGLFSLKAKRCLERADAVVYDRLADPRILGFARKDAEMIYVGKQSSQHTLPQDEINKLLVKLAGESKTVARLKGGDPLVFGRGGEEALALKAAGIAFEFVPGVSSAIAVPEYAGIPVTHRKTATSFAVITGHEDPTKETSGINWKGLATGVDTLVFLMGVENIGKISEQLIANGRSADCPAAVIRWGTHPEQETLVTTVGRAYADVKANNIKPPAIYIVGEVVNLREKLAWFDNKPLFGRTVVVTRARSQASRLSEMLEDLGAKVIEAPAIKIRAVSDYSALDKALDAIHTYKWVIFTSANGVKYFFNHAYKAGLDARALAGSHIAAIGSGTAKALGTYGLKADLMPGSYIAEELAKALKGKVAPTDRILLPRASVAREVLPNALRKLGAWVDVVPVYNTVADCENKDALFAALESGGCMITFTSSSTVRNFMKVLAGKKNLLKNAETAVIGPVTGETLKKYGFTPTITAKEFTVAGLLDAIAEYYKK